MSLLTDDEMDIEISSNDSLFLETRDEEEKKNPHPEEKKASRNYKRSSPYHQHEKGKASPRKKGKESPQIPSKNKNGPNDYPSNTNVNLSSKRLQDPKKKQMEAAGGEGENNDSRSPIYFKNCPLMNKCDDPSEEDLEDKKIRECSEMRRDSKKTPFPVSASDSSSHSYIHHKKKRILDFQSTFLHHKIEMTKNDDPQLPSNENCKPSITHQQTKENKKEEEEDNLTKKKKLKLTTQDDKGQLNSVPAESILENNTLNSSSKQNISPQVITPDSSIPSSCNFDKSADNFKATVIDMITDTLSSKEDQPLEKSSSSSSTSHGLCEKQKNSIPITKEEPKPSTSMANPEKKGRRSLYKMKVTKKCDLNNMNPEELPLPIRGSSRRSITPQKTPPKNSQDNNPKKKNNDDPESSTNSPESRKRKSSDENCPSSTRSTRSGRSTNLVNPFTYPTCPNKNCAKEFYDEASLNRHLKKCS